MHLDEYQYNWKLVTTLIIKKGPRQKLLQETYLYMHVINLVEAVPTNIASFGVQASNASPETILWGFKWLQRDSNPQPLEC